MRLAALDALSKHTFLPENILQAIASQLKHGDLNVRRAAVDALRKHTSLPENISRL